MFVPVILVLAGAPARRPDVGSVFTLLQGINFATFGVLTLLVSLVGYLLQPLQFGATQLLEGYWGRTSAAKRAMRRSAEVHLKILREAQLELEDASFDIELHRRRATRAASLHERLHDRGNLSDDLDDLVEARLTDRYRDSVSSFLDYQEASRVCERYPDDPHDVMPTRLGNMLRRFERRAGASFGLEATQTTGLLAQVTDETLRNQHDDARTDLDVSVRLVLVWAITSVTTFALLWQHDTWILVSLTCFALSLLSYRGSVAAAQAYGETLEILHTLGRFELYDALQLPRPSNSRVERRQNAALLDQLNGEVVELAYRVDRAPGSKIS